MRTFIIFLFCLVAWTCSAPVYQNYYVTNKTPLLSPSALAAPTNTFTGTMKAQKFLGDGSLLTGVGSASATTNADDLTTGTLSRPVATVGAVAAATLHGNGVGVSNVVAAYVSGTITNAVNTPGNIAVGGTLTATNADFYGTTTNDVIQADTLEVSGDATFNAGVTASNVVAGQARIWTPVAAGSDGQNLFIGEQAGSATLDTLGGPSSYASANTGVGYNALASLTSGYQNSAFGYSALGLLSTGRVNSAFGYGALSKLTTGSSDCAFGDTSLSDLIVGDGNTAYGADSLVHLTNGNYNCAFGGESLASMLTGNYNTGVGYNSLNANNLGIQNTAVGAGALAYSTGSGISYRTAIGSGALGSSTSGYNDVAVGAAALVSSQTGYYNTAVGWQSFGIANVSGYGNIGLGAQSGTYETGSLKLYIDSIDRTTEDGGRTNSLIYGVMNASSASQTLALNADVTVKHNLTTGGSLTASNLTLSTPAWRDMIVSGLALGAGASAPGIVVIGPTHDGLAIRGFGFAHGEDAGATCQLDHDATVTNSAFPSFYIQPHVHISAVSLAAGTNATFRMVYEWAPINSVYTNFAGAVTNTLSFTNLYDHRLLSFGNITNNLASGTISSIFRFQIERQDGGAGDIGNTRSVVVDSVDIHYPVNRLGSSAPVAY